MRGPCASLASATLDDTGSVEIKPATFSKTDEAQSSVYMPERNSAAGKRQYLHFTFAQRQHKQKHQGLAWGVSFPPFTKARLTRVNPATISQQGGNAVRWLTPAQLRAKSISILVRKSELAGAAQADELQASTATSPPKRRLFGSSQQNRSLRAMFEIALQCAGCCKGHGNQPHLAKDLFRHKLESAVNKKMHAVDVSQHQVDDLEARKMF